MRLHHRLIQSHLHDGIDDRSIEIGCGPDIIMSKSGMVTTHPRFVAACEHRTTDDKHPDRKCTESFHCSQQSYSPILAIVCLEGEWGGFMVAI